MVNYRNVVGYGESLWWEGRWWCNAGDGELASAVDDDVLWPSVSRPGSSSFVARSLQPAAPPTLLQGGLGRAAFAVDSPPHRLPNPILELHPTSGSRLELERGLRVV
jgi:hypothetical protein